MSDLTERPTDAADPTYPDAERCAQTLEACEDDLLTEAQFVRWQGREIERLTEENRRLRADLLAGRNVVNAGLTIHTLTIERDMLRQEIERLTAALRHEADCVEAAKAEIERLTAERDELRRQLDPMGEYASADELIAALRAEKAEDEAMKLDAQRYRWLRPRFFAADFAYSDPPVCAIVFRWPESAKISANLDREIDAAMGASNE